MLSSVSIASRSSARALARTRSLVAAWAFISIALSAVETVKDQCTVAFLVRWDVLPGLTQFRLVVNARAIARLILAQSQTAATAERMWILRPIEKHERAGTIVGRLNIVFWPEFTRGCGLHRAPKSPWRRIPVQQTPNDSLTTWPQVLIDCRLGCKVSMTSHLCELVEFTMAMLLGRHCTTRLVVARARSMPI